VAEGLAGCWVSFLHKSNCDHVRRSRCEHGGVGCWLSGFGPVGRSELYPSATVSQSNRQKYEI